MNQPDARPHPRFVDAHVHLWDPARTEWYPYLSGGRDIGMGDVTGMARRFDAATHRAEAVGWQVDKLVNVAAATGAHSVEETLALDRLAADEGQPAAIVGGIPPADSVTEAIDLIDAQRVASRFRGVRPMGAGADPVPADDVLAALAERGLVFELMAHAPQLEHAARRLRGHDELTVVVEHTGWPRSGDDDERATWHRGIEALADLGPQVHCKLSGLAMPLASVQAEAQRPWIRSAIDVFGPQRCMFASNFPVDGMHGTLADLLGAFDEITADLDDATREALFASNAERVYRC